MSRPARHPSLALAPVRAEAEGGPTPREVLAHLRSEMLAHPLWTGSLLTACRAGQLGREDFRDVLSQLALTVRTSTRLLHALRGRCESEPLRARLMAHICEDSGLPGAPPGRAWCFERFLAEGLGVDVEAVHAEGFTQEHLRESLEFCLHASPAAACAFLALGTEALLPRLSAMLLEGLRQVQVDDTQLRRYHQLLEEDGRADTLEALVLSHAGEPGWEEACRIGMLRALVLHVDFFARLFTCLQLRRLGGLLSRIQSGRPRLSPTPAPEEHRVRDASVGEALYSNRQERFSIDFTVSRLPLRTEVLTPCVLRIPPGRSDEWRCQAHEALLVVQRGGGEVRLEQTRLEVRAGDVVFVPRWAVHQTHNTGGEELVLLVVTDAGLTARAWLGDALEASLLRRGADRF